MSTYELNAAERKHLIALTRLAITNFNEGDWEALAAYANATQIVAGHGRLLRSLSFRDDDYPGNAHGAMFAIAEKDPDNLRIIEDYVTHQYGEPGELVSTASSNNRMITFKPSVFEVPDTGVERDLIAVMSPFAPEFENVFGAISVAAASVGYRVLRAKDIWQHTAVIQDVFSLIFRAHIVVCDFTGKNPNVFYEAGIAHTLGKHVVPITQFPDDIPFDLRHHRYQTYHNNGEGRGDLSKALADRFNTLR